METKLIKKTCCNSKNPGQQNTHYTGEWKGKVIHWIRNFSETTLQLGCAAFIGNNFTTIIEPNNLWSAKALNIFFTTALYCGARAIEIRLEEGKENAQRWYNQIKLPAFVINFFTHHGATKLLGVVAGILLLKDFYVFFGSMLISAFSFVFWTSKGVQPFPNNAFTTPCRCGH